MSEKKKNLGALNLASMENHEISKLKMRNLTGGEELDQNVCACRNWPDAKRSEIPRHGAISQPTEP